MSAATLQEPQTSPSAPAGPGRGDVPRSPARGHGRRRWSELVAVAGVAAVVASGVTVAVTENASAGASALGPAVTSPASPTSTLTAQDWTTVASRVSPSVVAITVTSGQSEGEGSGVVWDARGDIVTNDHVVAGAGPNARIEVRVGAQQTYAATVVGADPSTDLAVVRLTNPPSGLVPIARAQGGSLAVGDPVMALGNPLGLSGTATTGIVSALDRPVTTQAVGQDAGSPDLSPASGSDQVVTNAIQTSAAINPGNSGGALVDAAGRLVGINSSIASVGQSGSQAGNIGIGFAIPVAEVSNIAGQIIAGGTVHHASLGVSVTDGQAKQGSATVAGAAIRSVTPGSPAADAGLSAGDVVTAVDGAPVDSADGLVGGIRGLAVGQKVTLTVLSGGAQRTVAVTLGSAD